MINLTLRNKLQRCINRNPYIFIHENAFGNVICEISAILPCPWCVYMTSRCIHNDVSQMAIWPTCTCRHAREGKWNWMNPNHPGNVTVSAPRPHTLSGKTSYHKISLSLEAARFGFRLFEAWWNLTGTSAASLINFNPSMGKFHMSSKMWDEITYPFPNFNGGTVEVWLWISNFMPHFITNVTTYPCWD